MLPIALGLVAALCYGASNVAVRKALLEMPEVETGAFVITVVGCGVALVAELVIVQKPNELTSGSMWPFYAAGVMSPGIAGLLFILAIQEIGAARTAVAITAAPLLAAVPAFLLLREPFDTALLVAIALICGGALLLASERLPHLGFARTGFAFALGAAAFIACRDNFVRWVARDHHLSGLAAGTAALAAASLLLFLYLVVRRGRATVGLIYRGLRPFLLGGIFLGAAYAALLVALTRGRVTVVTPLYATESLWTVLLATLLLRRSEPISARLLVAASLMVTGAAVIGIVQ